MPLLPDFIQTLILFHTSFLHFLLEVIIIYFDDYAVSLTIRFDMLRRFTPRFTLFAAIAFSALHFRHI